uniref:EF-hand domain-containing protein n=1 Tax=Globisporangium ultimum (strain ATCC 200006 / CBS 805.95 / DAOM BR144) TaxID=431595 RepID=K3WVI3_GLOUD
MSFRGKSPKSDLTIPLNDTGDETAAPASSAAATVGASSGAVLHSLKSPRQRKYTVGSEMMERDAKLKIDMDERKKGMLKQNAFAPGFKFNAEMAIRVACGVLIASAIQTRESDYDPQTPHSKKWVLFPDWFYLGGLSYCATAVIFTTKDNIGATIREVCQGFIGNSIALLYNIVVFSIINMRTSNPVAVDPTDGFIHITRTFSSSAYWVNLHNFYVILPFMILFTVAILLLPFETNTKKFALGNNLYFALTIINPTDPLNSKLLKQTGDKFYEEANILKNLWLYFLVGFIGTLISLFITFVPYPVFGIKRLRAEVKKSASEILDVLNLIVDSYCFKNKNVEHMDFLRVTLQRKFEAANARNLRMATLVEDVWWEQLFGIHYLLKFNRSMVKNQVRLLTSLTADLRSLSHAMKLEQYEKLHIQYMKTLQREIYIIQLRSGDLLTEICEGIDNSVEHLELKSLHPLEIQMENTLHRYRSIQNRTLRTKKATVQEIAGNVPLNLFLFSLNSFCTTLVEFQASHNAKEYDDGERAKKFITSTVKSFFFGHTYTRLELVSTFKSTAAITMGIFLSVYVYAFSNTTPGAVAYVMGNHIGGSFSITVNRVGGVVAGSVVPSVFQFFISQVCDPRAVNVVLTSLVLFVWVAVSMYFRFAGGYGNYAGLVSAFIAAGILLRQSDVCLPGGADTFGSIAISSYSSLAQTSVGILLFLLVELALLPESATRMLRRNIQDTLAELQKSFDVLFGHHMSSSDVIGEEILADLRDILTVKIPKLLAEQEKLLGEANAEPSLWRPPFSSQKYESVLKLSKRLLSNNNLLFKLVSWFNFRVKQNKVNLKNTVDIRDGGDDNTYDDGDATCYQKWAAASSQFQTSMMDTFATLNTLFGDGFVYAEPEQTAIFMQIKEAFRLADRDCSGEIDSDEVMMMLQNIFAQSGVMDEDEINKYTAEFMGIVDRDGSGKVSFDEFMDALENGLKLEVEVYQKMKPKAPIIAGKAPTDRGSLGGTLLRINEEAEEGAPAHHDAGNALNSPSNAAAAGTPTINYTAQLTPKNDAVMLRKYSAVSTGTAGGFTQLSPMRRQHDVLNVQDFTLDDIARNMKEAYVEWLMEESRFEKVSMEELLLLSCLVSGAEGIAINMTALQEASVLS